MKKKSLNINVILIGLVLIFGIGMLVLQNINKKTGAVAYVYGGKMEPIMTIDLSKDGKYDIKDGFFDVHLVVKDGAIAFENSECPDHLCEGFGFISAEDEYAICMPAGIGVMIGESAK